MASVVSSIPHFRICNDHVDLRVPSSRAHFGHLRGGGYRKPDWYVVIPRLPLFGMISTAPLVGTAVSGLSRRLRQVISDPGLNPWRRPILHRLHRGEYGTDLANLSLRMIVPKYNWIEIMSNAHPEFLLFQATVPNLNEHEWDECFRRRFLPSWAYWKKNSSWRVAFHKYAKGANLFVYGIIQCSVF